MAAPFIGAAVGGVASGGLGARAGWGYGQLASSAWFGVRGAFGVYDCAKAGKLISLECAQSLALVALSAAHIPGAGKLSFVPAAKIALGTGIVAGAAYGGYRLIENINERGGFITEGDQKQLVFYGAMIVFGLSSSVVDRKLKQSQIEKPFVNKAGTEGEALDCNGMELSGKSQTLKVYKKSVALDFKFAEEDQVVETAEGQVPCKTGDAVLTGTRGERWPISRAKFESTYDFDSETGTCWKKMHKTLALRMESQFTVKDSRGDPLNGNPGDWLVQYSRGDFGIVKGEIFGETYAAYPNFEVLFGRVPSIRAIDIERAGTTAAEKPPSPITLETKSALTEIGRRGDPEATNPEARKKKKQ
jgi:hypothetical protein